MSQAGATNTSSIPIAVVETLTGNSGGAVGPSGNNINTVGTGSITVVGNPGTNTLTTQLTGLTNHAILVGAGTATITKIGPLTDGQLLIGSTGVDPVPATLTAGTNVSITNGPASITIAASTTSIISNYTAVTHADSPYTVLSTDYYLGVSTNGGVVSILLPNAPTTGRTFVVKDTLGTSVTNNITVTTVGGAVKIDVATTYVISTSFQSIQLMFNGATYEVF